MNRTTREPPPSPSPGRGGGPMLTSTCLGTSFSSPVCATAAAAAHGHPCLVSQLVK